MGVRPPPLSWVALDAREVFQLSLRSGHPRTITASPESIRVALGVPSDTRLLVYLNGSDPRLEGLYAMGTEVGETLKRIGVSLVGAPSFSVFLTRPRLDQVFNLRRMFTVLGELEEQGIPVFPNVFAASEDDIGGWIRWVADRPHLWVVGAVLQQQSPAFFDDQVKKLVWLQRALNGRDPPLHVVLYGVSSLLRARRARSLGLRYFTCVASRAAMTAAHGRRLVLSGERLVDRPEPGVSREHLLAANLEAQLARFAELPMDSGGYIGTAREVLRTTGTEIQNELI